MEIKVFISSIEICNRGDESKGGAKLITLLLIFFDFKCSIFIPWRRCRRCLHLKEFISLTHKPPLHTSYLHWINLITPLSSTYLSLSNSDFKMAWGNGAHLSFFMLFEGENITCAPSQTDWWKLHSRVLVVGTCLYSSHLTRRSNRRYSFVNLTMMKYTGRCNCFISSTVYFKRLQFDYLHELSLL